MRTNKMSVCPSGCEGGYGDRQCDRSFTQQELAYLPKRAPDGRLLSNVAVRWCSYCGCVYLCTEPLTILGYKDEEPMGPVSWVPASEWRS